MHLPWHAGQVVHQHIPRRFYQNIIFPGNCWTCIPTPNCSVHLVLCFLPLRFYTLRKPSSWRHHDWKAWAATRASIQFSHTWFRQNSLTHIGLNLPHEEYEAKNALYLCAGLLVFISKATAALALGTDRQNYVHIYIYIQSISFYGNHHVRPISHIWPIYKYNHIFIYIYMYHRRWGLYMNV